MATQKEERLYHLMQVKLIASAILSTFIKLTFFIKIFVLSIFEWPLKTGFTVFQFEILGSYLITICVLSTNILRGVSTYLGSDPTAEISRALMNSVISSSICWILTIILSTLLKKFMVSKRLKLRFSVISSSVSWILTIILST